MFEKILTQNGLMQSAGLPKSAAAVSPDGEVRPKGELFEAPAVSPVLLVGDDAAFTRALAEKIVSGIGQPVKIAESAAEAGRLIKTGVSVLALVTDCDASADLFRVACSRNLPVIRCACEAEIPAAGGSLSPNVIEVADHTESDGMEAICRHLLRLRRNPDIKALWVGEVAPALKSFHRMLSVHRFRVLAAGGVREAEKMLRSHPDIRLAMIGETLSDKSAIEFAKQLRKAYSAQRLAVIGIAADAAQPAALSFLRAGVTDVVCRDVHPLEFHCRLIRTIDSLEAMRRIRDASNRDYLTGLFNRRVFLRAGRWVHESSIRKGRCLAVAVIDIDRFKAVNDRCGHQAGDQVLKTISRILRRSFRKNDLVARYGGEEFAVLLTDVVPERILLRLDGVRTAIENLEFTGAAASVKVTVTIGACAVRLSSLEKMIRRADEMLFSGKRRGRNRVVCTLTDTD